MLHFTKYELGEVHCRGLAVIAPFSRSRAGLPVLAIPPQVLSALLLTALTLLVVVGFLVSLLAPVLFPGAFSGVEIQASDLTPWMNGW